MIIEILKEEKETDFEGKKGSFLRKRKWNLLVLYEFNFSIVTVQFSFAKKSVYLKNPQ